MSPRLRFDILFRFGFLMVPISLGWMFLSRWLYSIGLEWNPDSTVGIWIGGGLILTLVVTLFSYSIAPFPNRND